MSIFASLDASGQPYEIAPGAPFSTFWVIVADEAEAASLGAPVGQKAAFEVSHPWTALDAYGAADLARFCIEDLILPAAPAGQQIASQTLDAADGAISVGASFEPIPPPPVPQEVSRGQAKQALYAAGKLDAVEAAIAAAPRPVQIYWHDFPSFHRDHPTLLSMAHALGMSSNDVDDLFRAAAQIR